MAGWRGALSKTRKMIGQVFSPATGDLQELDLEAIEEILLRSDVPARLTMDIVAELESASRRVLRKERLREMLLQELGEDRSFDWSSSNPPQVITPGWAGKTKRLARGLMSDSWPK